MIGVFDSGAGGLTVLTAVKNQQPDTQVLYVGDQKYSPYGELTHDALLQRCRLISQWFIEQGVSLIVVACNTATAITIETLRSEFSIPFIGIEPAIKPAASQCQTGEVGLLATENTVASTRFAKLLKTHSPNVTIHTVACSGLADAIESDPTHANLLLERYIAPLVQTNIDHLVLGCTHYPLLRQQIESRLGESVSVIETGSAVAVEVSRVYRQLMSEASWLALSDGIKLFSTDPDNQMKQVITYYESLGWLAGYAVEHLEL